MTRLRNQKGAALLETAITLPLVLLVCVSIFEFGRAYQTWQVLTNAAREGARVSVINGNSDEKVTEVVVAYMTGGQLPETQISAATIGVNRNVPFGATTASEVTVTYPFQFSVLNPVMRLVRSGSQAGAGTTMMVSKALMRNE
jgi:Flp pilus assembly protein TadG